MLAEIALLLAVLAFLLQVALLTVFIITVRANLARGVDHKTSVSLTPMWFVVLFGVLAIIL